MKTVKSAGSILTLVINKSKSKRSVQLTVKNALAPTVLYSNSKGSIVGNTLNIAPEETMLIEWK